MSDPRRVGGIDLGGTKILSLLLTPSLTIEGNDRRPTEADRGLSPVIQTMAESLLAAAGQTNVGAVGVSTAGACDPARGIVTVSPNLPGWKDVPLAEMLRERLHLPVWIENDANAAAIAEHRLGAGRGSQHMLLVTLGTGVGAGLILNGRLYSGASGGAGEIGHMVLVPDGPPCTCGRRGCLEALAAGWALGRDASELAARQPQGEVARIAAAEGVEPDARILDLAADAGDASAAALIEQAGRYLGTGLSNVVNVFNPEVIVIGGSLRKLGDRYLGTALEVVARDAFPQHAADVRFVEAELGDEAPAIGAALIALEKLAASTTGSS